MSRILIVDDECTARKGVVLYLKNQKDDIFDVESKEQAAKLLKLYDFDVAIIDIRLPTEEKGLNLIKHIHQTYSLTPVLAMTAFGSIDSAIKAMKAGAEDYITKDFSQEVIILKVKKLLETRKMWFDNIRLANQVKSLKAKVEEDNQIPALIGESSEIRKILNMVSRIGGDNDTTVLITGESGTGKELIARLIHSNSPKRKDKKFVEVDIANLPATLLETQLFGHQKGAFTNAIEQKAGLFEIADGGTVFLDEIGDFPHELQVKLLRFLQEKKFMRIGSSKTLHADVRIIAATNKNLEELVEKQLFREDLFYRLNVVRLHLPPLRERKNDIPILIREFQRQVEEKKHKTLVFPDQIVQKMKNYDWPGNVRQLKNIIESLYVICPEQIVRDEDVIFDNILTKPEYDSVFLTLYNLPLKQARQKLVEKFEKGFLKHQYYIYNGNISKIAAKVGESREGISRKIKKYGIKE